MFSKFYDGNHEAMVEVVRDTVGRHDTFNLACTSKYYEDLGYMGHINCTDNFNKELEKYDVKARKSWSAINRFYQLQYLEPLQPQVILLRCKLRYESCPEIQFLELFVPYEHQIQTLRL